MARRHGSQSQELSPIQRQGSVNPKAPTMEQILTQINDQSVLHSFMAASSHQLRQSCDALASINLAGQQSQFQSKMSNQSGDGAPAMTHVHARKINSNFKALTTRMDKIEQGCQAMKTEMDKSVLGVESTVNSLKNSLRDAESKILERDAKMNSLRIELECVQKDKTFQDVKITTLEEQ